MLVNWSIRNLDSKGMRASGKACAARPRYAPRYAGGMQSASSEELSVKVTIEDRKGGNMTAEFKRKKTVDTEKG